MRWGNADIAKAPTDCDKGNRQLGHKLQRRILLESSEDSLLIEYKSLKLTMDPKTLDKLD